jgi:cytidylate kinase
LEKINFIIREIANKHNLGDQSVIAQTIDNNFRVNLGVDKSFKILQEKKNILLEIEIKLKKLDNTLEVFIDEQLDKNKLRIKNSPQTKLLN